MKLSISNIAWTSSRDDHFIEQIASLGLHGVEVAPSIVWPNWEGISDRSVLNYAEKLKGLGLEVPALQAILFGFAELSVFDQNNQDSQKLDDHFKLVCSVAQGLGAKCLVFGAPKNRRRWGLKYSDAVEIAADRFSQLGEIAHSYNTCIGMEANPVDYSCDFLTNTGDVIEFVNRVNHPSVKVHLDIGGMTMSKDPVVEVISSNSFIHFHISEPFLGSFSEPISEHKEASKALKESGYDGYVSIEMGNKSGEPAVFEAIEFAQKQYL